MNRREIFPSSGLLLGASFAGLGAQAGRSPKASGLRESADAALDC